MNRLSESNLEIEPTRKVLFKGLLVHQTLPIVTGAPYCGENEISVLVRSLLPLLLILILQKKDSTVFEGIDVLKHAQRLIGKIDAFVMGEVGGVEGRNVVISHVPDIELSSVGDQHNLVLVEVKLLRNLLVPPQDLVLLNAALLLDVVPPQSASMRHHEELVVVVELDAVNLLILQPLFPNVRPNRELGGLLHDLLALIHWLVYSSHEEVFDVVHISPALVHGELPVQKPNDHVVAVVRKGNSSDVGFCSEEGNGLSSVDIPKVDVSGNQGRGNYVIGAEETDVNY